MTKVSSLEELKDYCLRRLGYPLVDINVSEEQIYDRIADAFQIYTEYHYDAVHKIYSKHEITQEDIDNKYLTVHDSIVGITRIFPLSSTWTKSYMWDLKYQLRLHELWDFTSINMTNFVITMQHLRNLELLFTGEVPIRFQKHMNRVYLDLAWGSTELPLGATVILEGYQIIDPETYADVYNDRILKELATCLIRRQFGEVLRKFGGVQLPGGLTLNGDQIYNQAVEELKQIESTLQDRFEIPPEMMMG